MKRQKRASDELAAQAVKAKQAIAAMARKNLSTFNEFVLRDEATGKRVKNAPLHEEWPALLAKHKRLVILTSPESGKSQQITVGYTLWMAGKDVRNFRCLIISKRIKNAEKFTRSLKKIVDRSPELQLVYPGMRKGDQWTVEALELDRGPEAVVKDPSWEISGADGSILGARYSLVIIDDLIDEENTRTEYRADLITNWLMNTLESRMLDGAQIVMLCNAWEEYDAAHKLWKEHGWHLHRSAIRDPKTGLSRWPERWPQERIDSYPAAVARRHLDCIARSADDVLFKDSWIERCLSNGQGLTLEYELGLKTLPPGVRLACGVDLASRKKKTADWTVLSVCLAAPKEFFGLGHLKTDREIIRPLYILRKRMSSPEIKDAIRDTAKRFPGTVFIVEDNAAQAYIVQDLQLEASEIAVAPFTTTAARKYHPEYGIGGIATEMSMGLWCLPSRVDENNRLVASDPELEVFINECRLYDPKGHAGDVLMSMWFVREGLRADRFQRFFDFAGDPLTIDDYLSAGYGEDVDEAVEMFRRAKERDQKTVIDEGERLWGRVAGEVAEMKESPLEADEWVRKRLGLL